MEVIIIGGGASGLMAALTAAEGGHSVTLLERQARVGKKLLATGNGRCNLTNTGLSIQNYHGESPEFAAFALSEFGVEDTLRYLLGLGLVTAVEPDGRVYPFSDSAGSVLDVLRLACDGLGVRTVTGAEVRSVKRGFSVRFGEEELRADRLIVCCGGLAGRKLGGGTGGYELLESLGHSRTKLRPALVQLRTDTSYVRALKGVRAAAQLRLESGGKAVAENCGEVQFTEYGVSGPAIFEISRSAAAGQRLVLNLLPTADALPLIRARVQALPGLTAEKLLTGALHNRLGSTLVRYAGIELNRPLSSLGDAELERVAAAVHGFSLELTGTLDFDSAQVTAGGIRTGEFKAETMESRLVPGLYACGEVLDIDGDCGGYNLQWAWSSGRLAGRLL